MSCDCHFIIWRWLIFFLSKKQKAFRFFLLFLFWHFCTWWQINSQVRIVGMFLFYNKKHEFQNILFWEKNNLLKNSNEHFCSFYVFFHHWMWIWKIFHCSLVMQVCIERKKMCKRNYWLKISKVKMKVVP